MIKLFKQASSYFIADKLKSDPISFRKAEVLIYLHFVMIGALVFFTISTFLFIHEGAHPSFYTVVFVFIILLIFKKTGSFVITANLIAFVWFAVVGPQGLQSGGLYSDDMVWLILIPLFVMLFSNDEVGFVWLIVLVLYFAGVLLYGKRVLDVNVIRYTPSFYVFSYMVLSVFIFIFLKISDTHRMKTIQLLNEKKQLLESQKQAVLEQKEVLKEIEKQLKISNQELETFAYSAAHDLKEPLRMVKMYTEFLKRSFKGHLEQSQLEYFGFVTEGVSQMQNLMDDLLVYSRLGKNTDDFKAMNMNERMLVIKNKLNRLINETDAEIICEDLPTIKASVAEISLLFQNLICNAIKFRKCDVKPQITIRVQDKGHEFIFSIQDNGIGIKKEYHEKIFTLFQRLHSSVKYEGTGVGLATCKKIVENLGGKMWLTSTEGEGSTFFFSIPKEPVMNIIRPIQTDDWSEAA